MHKRNNIIKFQMLLWSFNVLSTVLAILYNYTTNLWRRQIFIIRSGSAVKYSAFGLRPGPSYVFNDVISILSGILYNFCINPSPPLKWIFLAWDEIAYNTRESLIN